MCISSKLNKFVFYSFYLSFLIILTSCGGGGTSNTSSPKELGVLSNGSTVYVSSSIVDVNADITKQSIGSFWLSGGNSDASYTITFTNQVTNSNSISSIESTPITIEPCHVGTVGSNLANSCNLEITVSKLTPSGVYQMVPTAVGNDLSHINLNPITIVVGNDDPSNSSNSITYFALNGIPGVISGNNIFVSMPFGTNITALAAGFVTTGIDVSVNGIIQQNTITPNNFTNAVVYTVTAANGTMQNYTVNVSIASPSANSITSFALNGISGVVSGNNISVIMPYGTNVTALVASFVITGSSININGVVQTNNVTPNNFTNAVVYTVTAANGTVQNYTVNVLIASNSANSITSFALNGIPGVVSGNNISITMPSGTNVTALVASFVATGIGISVNGVSQINNITSNNFTNPIVYTVTAANGTIQNYTVNVVIASASANSIISFALNGIPGVISGDSISITMPYGTNVIALIAGFVTTGVNVSVNGISQVNNITANNFTNPIVYTVTAANGTIQNYTVNVVIASNGANSILQYSINGISGVISGNNISVTMPSGTNVTSLVAAFVATGASISVNGMPQVNNITSNDFTNPVVYTVTAANGTMQNYTVSVFIAGNSANSITYFALHGVIGVISGNNISVTMPFGTNVTALIASYISNGQYVTVNGVIQQSTVTSNDFTNPVVYTVTAANGTIQNYTVTVILVPDTSKLITEYSIDGNEGTISGRKILVTVPFGTDETDLVADFVTTGVSVSVNGAIQTSGDTSNNFTNPVIYTVTAADGTIQTYTIIVTIAENDAKDFTFFALNAIPGIIAGSTITVTVPSSAGLDLIASYTMTGEWVAVKGTIQENAVTMNNFSMPLIYSIVAADGTVHDYTVIVIVIPV